MASPARRSGPPTGALLNRGPGSLGLDNDHLRRLRQAADQKAARHAPAEPKRQAAAAKPVKAAEPKPKTWRVDLWAGDYIERDASGRYWGHFNSPFGPLGKRFANIHSPHKKQRIELSASAAWGFCDEAGETFPG